MALAEGETWRIVLGDALETMGRMEAGTVDAVITDPPYYRVKQVDWDCEWESDGAFVSWMGTLAEEWRRLLAPHGSLYVFCYPTLAARLEVALSERFRILNRIAWVKNGLGGHGIHSRARKEALRRYFPQKEEVIFAEQVGAGEASATGRRRPFRVTARDQYTDVWQFPVVQHYGGKHLCEKPLALMRHLVGTSTDPGDVVLDCFSGSASTGHACLELGRRFVGVERDRAWYEAGRERLAKVSGQRYVADQAPPVQQMELF